MPDHTQFTSNPKMLMLSFSVDNMFVLDYITKKVRYALFLPFILIRKMLLFTVKGDAYGKVAGNMYGLYFSKDGLLIFRISDYFAVHDVFEAEAYDRFSSIEPDFKIVDVGAHIGTFTLHCAKRASQGLVVAVEPCPSTFRLLKLNIRINGLRNVVPVKLALSSSEGSFHLFIDSQSTGNSMIPSLAMRKKMPKSILVKAITFEHLLKNNSTLFFDLVKIDVEGAELSVLLGCNKALAQCKRFVIASYHSPTEANEIESFLKNKAYFTKRYHVEGDSYIYAIYNLLPKKCQH